MAYNTNSFINNIVAISVGVIIFAMVALPIITNAADGIEDTNLKAIVTVLPIFIAIGLLLGCVTFFISKKGKADE